MERLTITLHCWPTRRPPRRAPTPPGARVAHPDEDRPTRRFALADVALDGDDLRDVERFDATLAEALVDVARRLSRVSPSRLADLRAIGYATRVEINAAAPCGTLDLVLPAAFIAGCQRLGLGVQVASDHALMMDRDERTIAVTVRE